MIIALVEHAKFVSSLAQPGCRQIVDKNNEFARRLRARISYDGADFHGVQKNADVRTVLSTLEESLRPALGSQIEFKAAGRTDAGVSATGQVITFDAMLSPCSQIPNLVLKFMVNDLPTSLELMPQALNSCLPQDLRILSCDIVPESFDVARDSRWKRYRYAIPSEKYSSDKLMPMLKVVASHAARALRKGISTKTIQTTDEALKIGPRPIRRKKAPCQPLSDFEAMNEAAVLFEGTHDFRNFQASGGDQMTTVRHIRRCYVERREDHGYDIVVEGDGFLYKMVRIIAGTLVMVGMGLMPPTAISTALGEIAPSGSSPGADEESAVKSGRKLTGPVLPPEHLCLEYIECDI
jgi:tRNA pseudouridine38-40 synthase